MRGRKYKKLVSRHYSVSSPARLEENLMPNSLKPADSLNKSIAFTKADSKVMSLALNTLKRSKADELSYKP